MSVATAAAVAPAASGYGAPGLPAPLVWPLLLGAMNAQRLTLYAGTGGFGMPTEIDLARHPIGAFLGPASIFMPGFNAMQGAVLASHAAALPDNVANGRTDPVYGSVLGRRAPNFLAPAMSAAFTFPAAV